mmetsp:Transcript_14684/g.20603  ORF Transcript_14684/g.20603 Transcript_14684/m.20603 type:complete len:265 (-) Transcript_14684:450-1244(-)
MTPQDFGEVVLLPGCCHLLRVGVDARKVGIQHPPHHLQETNKAEFVLVCQLDTAQLLFHGLFGLLVDLQFQRSQQSLKHRMGEARLFLIQILCLLLLGSSLLQRYTLAQRPFVHSWIETTVFGPVQKDRSEVINLLLGEGDGFKQGSTFFLLRLCTTCLHKSDKLYELPERNHAVDFPLGRFHTGLGGELLGLFELVKRCLPFCDGPAWKSKVVQELLHLEGIDIPTLIFVIVLEHLLELADLCWREAGHTTFGDHLCHPSFVS